LSVYTDIHAVDQLLYMSTKVVANNAAIYNTRTVKQNE